MSIIILFTFVYNYVVDEIYYWFEVNIFIFHVAGYDKKIFSIKTSLEDFKRTSNNYIKSLHYNNCCYPTGEQKLP